jgi:hypothetical protein
VSKGPPVKHLHLIRFAVGVVLCHAAALQAGQTAPAAASPASAALAARAAVSRFPALRIVSPKKGARIGPIIKVDFETRADLSRMAMSAKEGGVHLRIGIDDTSLVPEMQDLKRIARNRYRYVFDLPAQPGPHVLSVYWSDANHRTIESTVRRLRVTVVTPKGKE